MLDPREQRKGGFGAFAARERERHSTGREPIAQADGAASGADAVPAREVASDATSDATGDATGNTGAPSSRRHFFGSLLP